MTSRRTKKVKPLNQELFDRSNYGHFYAPNEIVKFLIDLSQPKPNEKILAIGLNPDDFSSIVASTRDYLIVNANSSPSINQLEDIDHQLFDVILCAPTFGIVSPEFNESNEEMWLKWSIHHMNENGRLAIILPIGLLSNYSQEPIRRFLIEESHIEAIIEVPSGWAQGTAIERVAKIEGWGSDFS